MSATEGIEPRVIFLRTSGLARESAPLRENTAAAIFLDLSDLLKDRSSPWSTSFPRSWGYCGRVSKPMLKAQSLAMTCLNGK